jgi:hypothetical protein
MDEAYEIIFVKSYFHRGLGRRIFAGAYGLEAFALKVKKRVPEARPTDP